MPNRFRLSLNILQSLFFRRFGHVNYEDPYFSVGLPIFSIHGNHDDPTREGGVEALAALDLLHVANLVNYFGKSNKVAQGFVAASDATVFVLCFMLVMLVVVAWLSLLFSSGARKGSVGAAATLFLSWLASVIMFVR